MTKAIIFDLDGLLADTEKLSYQIRANLMKEYDIEFSLVDYVENISGRPMHDSTDRLIEMTKIPLSKEEVMRRLIDDGYSKMEYGIEMKFSAKEIVEYFKDKGYKLALATSSNFERAKRILKKGEIFEYFDEYVTFDDVTKGKPDPEVFLKAAEKLREKPEDCLVLEDSEFGIEAASRAGIPVICIPDMKEPSKQYLDKTYMVLDNLLELKKFY